MVFAKARVVWGLILPPPPLPLHRWVSRCGGSFVYGRAFGMVGHKLRGGRSWHLWCRVWSISPLAAASFFLDAQKEAKEAPGVGAEGQNRLRRPCPNVAHPLDPHFTGAAN